MSSPETSLFCSDETESSSGDDDGDSSTPSNSEEEKDRSGDESDFLAAQAKRGQWLVSDDGIRKIKGEDEGFEPAPLVGWRACCKTRPAEKKKGIISEVAAPDERGAVCGKRPGTAKGGRKHH
mmetsp:Transcript_37145/g.57990  ORF Transcript_37145/g.57990 Transcript_37145/m.57990 type:complete len:123 (-) Transcript_37145:173-541(-)